MQRIGQYTLLEQIILFAAGLTIAFGFLVAFRGLGNNAQAEAVEVQSKLVGRFLASSMVELVESGGEGHVRFDPPDTIGAKGYAISIENGNITVIASGLQRQMTAYGLLTKYDHSGRIEARDTEATIKLQQNQITVDGE